MPYSALQGEWILTPELEKVLAEKNASIELQKRKQQDWNDNNELYRNKVKTNRLTQRQAVNIPLMKETVKTLLSKIDDPPNVDWRERANDEYKELIYQEIWNDQYKWNNLELIDILDKKNVLLYGHSVKKLNLDDRGISIEVLDVYDTLFDPLMKPWDLESSRYIIHQNIFKTVREILADDRYDKKGKEELKIYAESPPGMVMSEQNKEEWEKKMERLRNMGVQHDDFQYYAGGDVLVNLTEHYTSIWNKKKQKFERRVVVYADNMIELSNESLMDLTGVDVWPFVMWSEDPETDDIYADSVADLVRVPNMVINVWFSQLVENRTLKNFQMHWFLPQENYQAQTYTPGPGAMLPAPPGDDINKVIKPVEISGLDDTLAAIQAVTVIAERGTGATAIEKGQGERGQQTLGEIQILVGKATERTTAMTKFYRIAWYELAKKWDILLNANAPRLIKLYKTGKSGKLYPKSVTKTDWKSTAGYEPTVSSSSEQEAEDVKALQKWQFILQQFPNNPALRRIGQSRQLQAVDLTPDELREVEEAEEQQANAVERQEAEVQGAAGGQPNPQENQLAQQVQQQMAQLGEQ